MKITWRKEWVARQNGKSHNLQVRMEVRAETMGCVSDREILGSIKAGCKSERKVMDEARLSEINVSHTGRA
jgi:3-methyladenine DNA glycosylase AlkD